MFQEVENTNRLAIRAIVIVGIIIGVPKKEYKGYI